MPDSRGRLMTEIAMRNFDWLVYTYKHRRAFAHVAKKLIKDEAAKAEILKRARVHDMDKMVMYLFLDQTESQLTHVKNQPHHLECKKQKNDLDLLETVIDYECAPYTKPDKPLNAYDFTNKLLEMKKIDCEIAARLQTIMHELGIDRSYNIHDFPEELTFLEETGEVTEEMILLEVMNYLQENQAPELTYVNERRSI